MDELPSRTDENDGVVREPVVMNNGPEILMLAPGETEHLRHLEERNRFLTMLLGDKVMAADETREELLEHRKNLKEAYAFILTTHGIDQGKIDTNSGVITVLKRTQKE